MEGRQPTLSMVQKGAWSDWDVVSGSFYIFALLNAFLKCFCPHRSHRRHPPKTTWAVKRLFDQNCLFLRINVLPPPQNKNPFQIFFFGVSKVRGDLVIHNGFWRIGTPLWPDPKIQNSPHGLPEKKVPQAISSFFFFTCQLNGLSRVFRAQIQVAPLFRYFWWFSSSFLRGKKDFFTPAAELTGHGKKEDFLQKYFPPPPERRQLIEKNTKVFPPLPPIPHLTLIKKDFRIVA